MSIERVLGYTMDKKYPTRPSGYDDKGEYKDCSKGREKSKSTRSFAITTGPLVIEDCSKLFWSVQSLSKGKTTVVIRLMKLDPDHESKDCKCCNRCVKSDCATIFQCGCGETGHIFVPEFEGDEQTFEVVFIADGPIKASVQFRGPENDDLVVLADDMLPYLCECEDKWDDKAEAKHDDKKDAKWDCKCDDQWDEKRSSKWDDKKDGYEWKKDEDSYVKYDYDHKKPYEKPYDDSKKKDCEQKRFAITTGPLTLDDNETIFFAVQSLAHGRTTVDVLLMKLDPIDPKEGCECCNRCVKTDCVTIFDKCCGENGRIDPPNICDKNGAFEVVFIANNPIRASIQTDTVDDSDAFLVPAARMQPYIIDDICDKQKC